MVKKPSPSQLQAIIGAERPGFEVCPPSLAPLVDLVTMNHRETPTSAPDLDYLRRKFLHIDEAASPPQQGLPSPSAANLEDPLESQEIVQIRPVGADPSRVRAKAAVVSGKTGKIVGEQG